MTRRQRHLSVVPATTPTSAQPAPTPPVAAREPGPSERSDLSEEPREVPGCNAPVLQGRDPEACGARSFYVVLMADGPVFACKRHLTVAVDARHREAYRHPGGGRMAVVWSDLEWAYAPLRPTEAQE